MKRLLSDREKESLYNAVANYNGNLLYAGKSLLDMLTLPMRFMTPHVRLAERGYIHTSVKRGYPKNFISIYKDRSDTDRSDIIALMKL